MPGPPQLVRVWIVQMVSIQQALPQQMLALASTALATRVRQQAALLRVVACATLGTAGQAAARAFLAWLALTNLCQEAALAPPVPLAQTRHKLVFSQQAAFATLDTQDQTEARAQLARDIRSKTPQVQQHAPPALATLLRHWAELVALRAWRERTRLARALWPVQTVLKTRSHQQAALILAAVFVV